VSGLDGSRTEPAIASGKGAYEQRDAVLCMRVYLFGAPRAEWAGQMVVLPRRQCRALLFRLAASADPLPREGLQFLLWPDLPDAEGRRNLTHLLTHLRRNLPDPDILSTPGDRVALDAARTWVDAREFARLCVAPEPLHLAALRQAISLYRGPFLDGFYLGAASPEFDSWNAQERYAHERTYLEALQSLIDEAEVQESLEEAISLAERYLAQDQLAEEMHRRLMALYVRAGQRTRALRQYERCVAALQQDLGVGPLQETQALHRSILKGDPKPAATPAGPPMRLSILPSLQTPLVGREDVLEVLGHGLARARSGQGGAWLISGESGIGKSRLLQEFVAGGASRSTTLGVCGHEAERSLPYGPLVEALWPYTEAIEQLSALDPIQRAELARLLPNLRPEAAPRSPTTGAQRSPSQRVDAGLLVEPTIATPGQQQLRLFQAFASAMQGLAARNPPLILCLDDLHWADSATLTWLSYFVRQIKHAAVMIVGAYRPEEAASLAPLRAELRRQGMGHELALRALTHPDVVRLVTHLGGRGPVAEHLSTQLHQQTGGNPFFLLETIRAMFEAGALRQDEGGRISVASGAISHVLRQNEQIPLTDSVQQAIRDRLARLDASPRQVLEAGAVLGYRFTLELLQATSARLEEEVVDAVEILLARQLFSEQEQNYVFNHEIIRTLIYRDLSSGRRQLLHRRAGEALQRLRPADIATLAWHYEQGEGATDRAVGYLLQAGDRARSVYAYEQASQCYQRAVALLKERGETVRAARVCMTLGLTAHLAMDFPRAHQAYADGFTLWHSEPAPAKHQPAPHALRGDWGSPVTFDPTIAGDAASAGIVDQLFTGLVELTPDMEVVPALARRWQVQENGCAYTFYLRDDALWSDGTPVTAADFVCAWRRVLDPRNRSLSASLLYDIRGGRAFHRGEIDNPRLLGLCALDETTLQVELEGPAGYFPHLLTCCATYPVPHHRVEADGSAWANPDRLVTNGPFRLDAWTPERHLRLIRQGHWAGAASGNVESVDLVLSLDQDAKLALYEQDELDVFGLWEFPALQAASGVTAWEAARQRHAGEYLTVPRLQVHYLGLNTTRPPLDDPRVRQALIRAVDREALAGVALRGYSAPATGGLIPPGMPAHTPEIGLPYDPAQARRLLAEAGYPGGAGLGALSVHSYRPPSVASAFLLDAWRDNLGVEAQWKQTDTARFFQLLAEDPPHLFSLGTMADYPDPHDLLRTGSHVRHTHWRDATYLDLVERAGRSTNQEERLQLYRQADQLLVQGAAVMPLLYSRLHLLIKPWVTHYPIAPLKAWYWKDVVIERH